MSGGGVASGCRDHLILNSATAVAKCCPSSVRPDSSRLGCGDSRSTNGRGHVALGPTAAERNSSGTVGPSVAVLVP